MSGVLIDLGFIFSILYLYIEFMIDGIWNSIKKVT